MCMVEKNCSTHGRHFQFAFGNEQKPSGKHSKQIRSQSRPRFIVQLVEQSERFLYPAEANNTNLINTILRKIFSVLRSYENIDVC